MAYLDLQSFIKKLDQEGELITIDIEVDCQLEITEISDRVMKGVNKALLFTNIKDRDFPLLINAFGSDKRINLALQVNDLSSIADDIHNFMNLASYQGIYRQIKSIPRLSRLYFSFPSKIKFKKAPCQEVIEAPNLNKFPVLKCWPDDGGSFFTLPMVFTKDPETGQQNIGMYRLQVYDHNTTGMHWHLHKDGKEIYEKYRELGIQKMPVSVAVGCDPATVYASTAPLPKMIDEAMFASFLRKKPLKMVKSITNNIYVPANAEIILEGYVDIDETRLEGPFGDHTGYYSLPCQYPVFHLTKITRKQKPIFHATIVGKPPMEDCYLSKATEVIFLPLIQMTLPEIKNMHLPFEGVFHNCALVAIDTKYPGHAHKTMYNFWGLGQMMYQKLIIIFNANTNLHDYETLFKTFVINCEPVNDIIITKGPLDALDHSSKEAFFGSRIGIDLTNIRNDDFITRYKKVNLTKLKKIDKNIINVVVPKINGYFPVLFLSFNKDKKKDTTTLISSLKKNEFSNNFKFIFLFDQFTDIEVYSVLFWRLFNNIDGQRDLYFNKDNLIIDATRKLPSENGNRKWPDDIIMSDDVITRVNEKWELYAIK